MRGGSAQPLAPANTSHPNSRDPNRRLKIGYVSPDFSEHPVGRFFLPLVLNHDPATVEEAKAKREGTASE